MFTNPRTHPSPRTICRPLILWAVLLMRAASHDQVHTSILYDNELQNRPIHVVTQY